MVSSYKLLNDPFEFKAVFLNRKEAKKYGWNTDVLEKCLESVKDLFQICCFSNNGINNMPLWAHYANNHNGYCVEYTVINKPPIYPIIYSAKRESVVTIPTKICSEIIKGIEKNEKPSKDIWRYLIYLYMTFTCKFEHWRYEDEFRLFNIESNVDKGVLKHLTKENLEVNKIYIGIYCKHKKELINIGKHLRCKVHEMV